MEPSPAWLTEIRNSQTALPGDPRIRTAIERCQTFMADKDDALSLPNESAQFIYALVRATRARRCLEIGTSYGHSGLWIAAASTERSSRASAAICLTSSPSDRLGCRETTRTVAPDSHK